MDAWVLCSPYPGDYFLITTMWNGLITKDIEFNRMFLLHALGHLRTKVTFSFSIEELAFVFLHL